MRSGEDPQEVMPALPYSSESEPSSRSSATQTPECPAGWDSSRRLTCCFGTVPASASPASLKTLRSGAILASWDSVLTNKGPMTQPQAPERWAHSLSSVHRGTEPREVRRRTEAQSLFRDPPQPSQR
ncbi:unnamed protein product [Rangifer tarandus platyrhynchus]|uniref:Uncharacterized protein n=2 Tax=Rangifer tarandus platyrhynchus TaxID=3082113 RepID=A0ACB0ETD9_RANTA|nr:unnamed protein product [Rangifer tarandus platyrhynchus]CAI9704027.1 unnamed protein product [Rangifer tarandus platyrhynchus]